MSGIPSIGLPASGSLLGILRSWLQMWSSKRAALPEDVPKETGALNAHCHGTARVLIVDDNPVNLTLISALMESRGLVPCLAADGAEAVALACELHFDLILMDLQMPILDGLGATSAIRRFESETSRPAVPVVAYTSLSPGADVLAAHGLNGSLSKPCTDRALDECLLRWCPSYGLAAHVGSAAHDNSCWQTLSRNPGTSRASLRWT